MLSQAGALIFDFDGVLADTEPLFWRAWERLLKRHNLPFSWEDYCRFGRGLTDEQMLRQLPQLQANPPLLAKLIDDIGSAQQLVQEWLVEHPPIPAETIAMLHGLRLQGFRIGLVSSSKRSDIEPVLRETGILDCFHASVTADDTVRHKPDPEPYLLMRTLLCIEHGLAFEDSDPGLASAAAAGLTAIRVDTPYRLSAIVESALIRA